MEVVSTKVRILDVFEIRNKKYQYINVLTDIFSFFVKPPLATRGRYV